MSNTTDKLKHLLHQLDPNIVESCFEEGVLDYMQLLSALVSENQALKHEFKTQQPLKNREGTESQLRSNPVVHQIQPQLDPLTQLPNRAFFNQLVEQAIHRSERNNACFALIFIDIDHFKSINDTHGHRTGDRLLKELSQRISKSIRQSDLLCRLAGDEFCLMVEGVSKVDAIMRVVDALKRNMTPSFEFDDTTIQVTTSIGVSMFPNDGKTFTDLLHFADLAMYEAKRSGRNTVKIFSPEISEHIHKLSKQQHTLKDALQSQSLEFWFQPELKLRTGRICSVRQYASLSSSGLESETALLETARRAKQILVFNLELFRSACQHIQDWKDHYKHVPRIIIPLFRELIASPNCYSLIRDILTKAGIDGNTIELEIDEQEFDIYNTAAVKNISRLYMLGFKISLINFGIGAASHALLTSGEISTIKVNSTLINHLESGQTSTVMLESIIKLCNKFNIQVFALDVSSLFQIKLLEQLKCDGIRGNYFSPAISIDEFEKLLLDSEQQKKSELPSDNNLNDQAHSVPPIA